MLVKCTSVLFGMQDKIKLADMYILIYREEEYILLVKLCSVFYNDSHRIHLKYSQRVFLLIVYVLMFTIDSFYVYVRQCITTTSVIT